MREPQIMYPKELNRETQTVLLNLRAGPCFISELTVLRLPGDENADSESPAEARPVNYTAMALAQTLDQNIGPR